MTKTQNPSAFDQDARYIFERQYALTPGETVEQGLRRVAKHVADAEGLYSDSGYEVDLIALKGEWADKFYDLMADKKFCPGGRTLQGSGSPHGQLTNCFVTGLIEGEPGPDSLDGIIELAVKLALITQKGGGNGLNLDVFQPQSVFEPLAGKLFTPVIGDWHPDAQVFRDSVMTPSNMPDAPKAPVTLRRANETRYESAEIRIFGSVIDVPDDLEGIIRAGGELMKRIARGQHNTLVKFSEMRAEGEPIRGTGGTSSGPFPFLVEIFDNFAELAARGGEKAGPINILRYAFAPVLRVVKQAGVRRGAGMATISIDNPHVLDFLTAKDLDREAAEGDISTFNISILATEDFMYAKEKGGFIKCPVDRWVLPEGKYNLDELIALGVTYGTSETAYLSARWLDEEIAQHAWATGEPGLIFADRVKEFSALKNLGKKYEIRSTNPLTLAA